MKNSENPASKITRAYMVALILVGLLTLISQGLVRYMLDNQAVDGYVINMAGRQRALSQKMVKMTLLLYANEDEAKFGLWHTDLKKSLDLWAAEHRILQFGSDSLGIAPDYNSSTIKSKLAEIEQYYIPIKASFDLLKKYNFGTPKDEMKAPIAEILANESQFLQLANEITAQYDHESKQKVDRLKIIELLLMFLTLLVLALEGFFIFRPAVHKINDLFTKIQDSNEKLIQNKEELEINVEELQSTEEELRQNMEELTILHENLQEKEESLTVALAENRVVTNAILDSAPLAILTLDLKGIIISANSAVRELLGYNPDELIGAYVADRLHEKTSMEKELAEMSKKYGQNFEKLEDFILLNLSDKTSTIKEWELVHKNGNSFSARIHSKAIRDKKGVIFGFIRMIEDISEQKEFETLIKQQNEELRNSEEELKHNLEKLQQTQEELSNKQKNLSLALADNRIITDALNNNIGVAISDLEGNMLKVNDIFCRSSGYMAGELIGRNHRIVNSGYHSKEFWASMWKTISNGNVWRGEVRNRAKNGSFYWVDTVINPVCDEYGKVLQYLSIRVLITERKNSEELIGKKNQELESSLNQITLLNAENEEARSKMEKLFKDVTDSIHYAKRIQNAIIPQESKIQKYFDSFVFFRPRDIVSGDFYWFADKDEQQILVLADCTGHGVSGAFMTMITNNILNRLIHDKEVHEPDAIIDEIPIRLAEVLRHSDGQIKDGMDIAVVLFEKNEEFTKLSYAGARIALVYVKEHQFFEIKADKMPIGSQTINKPFQYQKHEIPNPQGATFYLFSDGFQDQFGGSDNTKFMSKNFKNLLFEISEKNMAAQKEILEDTFEHWKGKNKQTDDILVLGFRM